MTIIPITVGELQVNCYLVTDPDTKQTLIIDPGAEPQKISSIIEKEKLKGTGIVNTHGHADHIGGNAYLREKYNCPIYIHPLDAQMLTDPNSNLSASMYYEQIISPPADKTVNENDIIKAGSVELKVLWTPGHTPGGISLLGGGYVFTGDTLFFGSIGRYDLPGASEKDLINSLKKLCVLPGDTVIYPGHGPKSTIAEELKNNPFLGY